MKRFAAIYITALLILFIASEAVVRIAFSQHYPSLMFIIPLFFLLMAGVMVFLKRANEKRGKDRSIFFLSYRIVKILLSIVLLLIYFTVQRTQLVTFSVVFAIYYLCLSAIETALFIKGEKKS